MNPKPPLDQIEAIKRSLRCFVFGLLAFIPILGLAMGAIACLHAYTVTRRHGDRWNPARDFLRWGRALGILGSVFSSALFALLLTVILTGEFRALQCFGPT